MFETWPDSDQLSMEKLRLKCITLMALCLMLRTSHLALWAICIRSGEVRNLQLIADKISFQEHGTAEIYLHGIKNDYNHDSFGVYLMPCSILKLCPVQTLKEYMRRNEQVNPSFNLPVFTPLNYPFSRLTAGAIASVLNKAIELMGLADLGYSAKSYHPTGATVAVQGKLNADSVHAVSCWNNRECFEEHYVHSKPDVSMTDVILLL